MPIRFDGTYVIYRIQHQCLDGTWIMSSLDMFGSPVGFTASAACWQQTGVRGTFDQEIAMAGLVWMRFRHPDTKFQLVRQSICQATEPLEY
jgi:hypothetical protein